MIPIQRAMLTPPGLVADGRDMGTVVFPDAQLKFYLDASVETRARRRLDQLQETIGQSSLASMVIELEQRDKRDRTRDIAPLKIPDDAYTLDTTNLSVDEMFTVARTRIHERLSI